MLANVEKAPRQYFCVESGAPLSYKGYGRPPKYSPEVKKARGKATRAERYVAKQAALGKTVRARGAKLA